MPVRFTTAEFMEKAEARHLNAGYSYDKAACMNAAAMVTMGESKPARRG